MQNYSKHLQIDHTLAMPFIRQIQKVKAQRYNSSLSQYFVMVALIILVFPIAKRATFQHVLRRVTHDFPTSAAAFDFLLKSSDIRNIPDHNVIKLHFISALYKSSSLIDCAGCSAEHQRHFSS